MGHAVCVFFHSALCERSFAGISEALCVCIFHCSRGVYDVVLVCFAFALCIIFIAHAVQARQCVCIFHCSPGVYRAVRLFSLFLYVIHSSLALYRRGSVCVYFISHSGYVGQCLCVYFHTRICAFGTSTAFTGAIAVYHF